MPAGWSCTPLDERLRYWFMRRKTDTYTRQPARHVKQTENGWALGNNEAFAAARAVMEIVRMLLRLLWITTGEQYSRVPSTFLLVTTKSIQHRTRPSRSIQVEDHKRLVYAVRSGPVLYTIVTTKDGLLSSCCNHNTSAFFSRASSRDQPRRQGSGGFTTSAVR